MRIIGPVPSDDSFRLPSELGKHFASYFLWPDCSKRWRLNAGPIKVIAENLLRTISEHEPVVLGVNSSSYSHVLALNLPNVHVIELSHASALLRDAAPSFLLDDSGELRAVDWRLDRDACASDDDIASKICGNEGLDRYRFGQFFFRSGLFEYDGEGTALVLEPAVLSSQLNPNLTKSEIETHLRDYLGIEKVLWLPAPLYKDNSGAPRLDNVARFIAPGRILLSWEDNLKDPAHASCVDNLTYLGSAQDARGRSLEVTKLHLPLPVRMTKDEAESFELFEDVSPRSEGERLPASYTAFYKLNDAILFPSFDDPHDRAAMNILESCFPGVEFIPFFSRELVLGGANLHSMLIEIPMV